MSRRVRPAFVALVLLAAGSPSLAKEPTLSGLFPVGATRGQTATVTASGSFDHWPVRGWADDDGIAIESTPEKGKLRFRIAADAEPGVHWVRLHDEEGATVLRPFVVGTLPELVESEPNDDPRQPQAISGPSVTINGRLAKAGDVDGFSVTLRRGEALVADVAASRHVGSPMDAVLQVVSPAGFVLAQNDDDAGHDPRIVFEAPADGPYIVRLFAFPATPDSSIRFAGGESFIYRLTLTTGGFLDHAFPLAVPRDGPANVTAFGSNIPEVARRLTVSGDRTHDTLRVWHPLLVGTAEVRVVRGPSAVESEPDDPARPQSITDIGAISGRIDPPGDRDAYRFALKKGDKRVVRIESRALGFPLDPVLRVTDAEGKTLAETDDIRGGRDPEVTFTAPADGEYRAVVRDLNDAGGPRFAYLLRLVTPAPDFSLSLASDRFEVTPGKSTNVAVTIDRKDGFSAPIEIIAEGLPDGVTAGPASSKPGDGSSKTVTLTLAADGCACPGPFRVIGRAAGDDEPRVATAPIPAFVARTDHPWLSIRPAPKPAKP
jgi:hypothetical protein